MWFLFAVFAAVCQAINQVVVKKYQTKNNYIILASITYFTSGLIFLLISIAKGIPSLGPDFWKAVILSGGLNIIAAMCFYKSLRLTDLSLAAPMLAFTPVFLTLNGYLILGEKPNAFGYLGIFSVVLGILFMNSPKASKLFHALRSIKNNKGILLMLLVAFLWSISTPFDKLAVLNSDFIFGVACISLFIFIFFTSYAFLRVKTQKLTFYKQALTGGLFISAINVVGSIFTNLAYLQALAAYVLSVKRLSILFGVLLGVFIFKEPELKKRLTGAVIAVIGVLFIVFS